MAKGILTVNAAGNDGPKISTVTSNAPWVFSVAASVTNRAFMAKVVLGNGKILIVRNKKQSYLYSHIIFVGLNNFNSYGFMKQGRSVNTYDLNGTKYPLVYGESAALSTCSQNRAK